MVRQICGCGVSGWTKGIAWIQIIVCSFVTLLVGFGLIALVVTGQDGFEQLAKENPQYRLPFGYIGLFVFLSLKLTVVSIGIVMGLILLKGSQQRNARYLKCWVIFTGICLILALVSILAKGTMRGMISSIIGTVAIYGFVIWVVRVHIQEIESDPQREPPPEYQATYAQKP